ncbi:hypothetical protein ACFRFQ_12155 [Rhodococcus sp. NPDC056743]|uniref:hypothetical protein n=1 Tax=Rhodococcus sp. NPDC056743 TaxID=3345934 RepID=UPI00366D3F4B
MVTFRGSSFHDLAAPELPRGWSGTNNVHRVLRSGCCGISHPHATFGKCSIFPEVDSDYSIVGAVPIAF